MTTVRRPLRTHFVVLLAGLAALCLAPGCGDDPGTPTRAVPLLPRAAIALSAPQPTSPTQVLQLLAWCWNRRATRAVPHLVRRRLPLHVLRSHRTTAAAPR